MGGPSLSCSPSKAQGQSEGRDQERDQERAGRQGGELRRAHIWTGHGCWLHQLLAALVTCKDLDKVKPIRILARMMAETERPRSYQRSYRQVMAAEGRRITPLGMWLVLCCSCLMSQSHNHLYVSSTKWAQRVVSKNKKREKDKWRSLWRTREKEWWVDMIKIHYNNGQISKE